MKFKEYISKVLSHFHFHFPECLLRSYSASCSLVCSICVCGWSDSDKVMSFQERKSKTGERVRTLSRHAVLGFSNDKAFEETPLGAKLVSHVFYDELLCGIAEHWCKIETLERSSCSLIVWIFSMIVDVFDY